MKVVINKCYGGFSLSEAAWSWLKKRQHPMDVAEEKNKWGSYLPDIPRDDPLLVEVVKTLGDAANGPFVELKIVEIPDDVSWDIVNYDGREHIAEAHTTWG